MRIVTFHHLPLGHTPTIREGERTQKLPLDLPHGQRLDRLLALVWMLVWDTWML
jgi:hypothetical protein